MKLLEDYIVLNYIKSRSAVFHSAGPPYPHLSQGCHPFDDRHHFSSFTTAKLLKKLNNRVRKDPGIKSKLCLFIRWANSSITYYVPKPLLIAHRQLYRSLFSSCIPSGFLSSALGITCFACSIIPTEFFLKAKLEKDWNSKFKIKSFTNV